MSCDAALRVSSSIPAVRIANLDSTRRFLEVKQLGCQRASPARESQDSAASGVLAGGRHADTPSRRHGSAQAGHRTPRVSPRGRPWVRPGGSGGAWSRAREELGLISRSWPPTAAPASSPERVRGCGRRGGPACGRFGIFRRLRRGWRKTRCAARGWGPCSWSSRWLPRKEKKG